MAQAPVDKDLPVQWQFPGDFQFVSMESLRELHDKDGSFAVAALQEIPDQYKAIQSLGLLN